MQGTLHLRFFLISTQNSQELCAYGSSTISGACLNRKWSNKQNMWCVSVKIKMMPLLKLWQSLESAVTHSVRLSRYLSARLSECNDLVASLQPSLSLAFGLPVLSWDCLSGIGSRSR